LWLTEFITTLLMLLISLVLIYGSYLYFWRAWEIGDSWLDINLPTWPAKLVVSVALSLLVIRLVLQLWGYARAIRQGGDTPAAVPFFRRCCNHFSLGGDAANRSVVTSPDGVFLIAIVDKDLSVSGGVKRTVVSG
jgi:hypothetical protein